jgi:DNA-directed RNA polymerase subunit RPC12/RpoP
MSRMRFEGKVYTFTVEARTDDPSGVHALRRDDDRTPLQVVQAAVTAEAESRVEDGPYRCASCGSPQVETTGYITLNSETIASMDETRDAWCPDCEDHEARLCYLIVNEVTLIRGGKPVDRIESCDFHKRPYRLCREAWDAECVKLAKENRAERSADITGSGGTVIFQSET